MRNAPIKRMDRVFAELAKNRKSNATWGVFRVLKSGQLSKRPSETYRNEEDAQDKAEYMTRINNSQYVVQAI